ncbi:hypothetical protein Bcep1808_6929 (plasmid) [Burkholderia vietnamiensis G4]|uniref:Uncharacterized protein n=1 Tax=Burkholderia vietnamiensis (strain G4 / LMG 22486) TaxID=269482 RepID=A4JU63_BURVG|nr:hypothetical protein Bcep1808_6929 [Burkholderia vietnamiensis G4]
MRGNERQRSIFRIGLVKLARQVVPSTDYVPNVSSDSNLHPVLERFPCFLAIGAAVDHRCDLHEFRAFSLTVLNVQRVGFHNQDRILPGINDKASVLSRPMLRTYFRRCDFLDDTLATLGAEAPELVSRHYFQHVQISERAQFLKGHRSFHVHRAPFVHCIPFRELRYPYR